MMYTDEDIIMNIILANNYNYRLEEGEQAYLYLE